MKIRKQRPRPRRRLMDSARFSMSAFHHTFCDGRGKPMACLGVDIQAARAAPVGKRFGVDEGAHHDLSVASKALLLCLGFHQPFVERSGELRAVGHDPEDGVVIFELVPDHANVLNWGGVHEPFLLGV